jgi:hypothetical protein
MSLNRHKRLEYIKRVLEEVSNGTINDKEDSILIEVAIEFADSLTEGGTDGSPEG